MNESDLLRISKLGSPYWERVPPESRRITALTETLIS